MQARERLEIEWACTKLAHAFSYAIDHRHYEDLIALFTPDGVWERHGQVLRGRAEILKAMEARPANQFTRHVTTSFHFTEVSETTAKATLYNMSWYSFEAESLPTAFHPEQMLLLDFIDTYRRTEEGWRIAERLSPFIMMPKSLLHK